MTLSLAQLGPVTLPEEDDLQGNGHGSQDYYLRPARLLPEACQVAFAGRQPVWTHGEAVWGEGMGFAARRTGLQPESLSCWEACVCPHPSPRLPL